MNTDTAVQPPDVDQAQEDPETIVSCHITDPDGTMYSASIRLEPGEPLSNVSAAVLSAAYGVAATHGPVLAALFRDLIETQRALANAIPVDTNSLRPGIRVSDVDQVIRAHRGASHQPHLAIPGLSHPVDADVVRAILVAAGAY